MKKSEIDLHGLSREDAFMLVEDELLYKSSFGAFEMDIITGNSKGMQEGVIKICLDHGFDYVVPSHNSGVVKVSYTPIY
jgi:hypothetical protein